MSEKDILDNIENLLCCPITQEILYEPIEANDGRFYEKEAYEKWITIKKISPISRENISIINSNPVIIKELIANYLQLYPEKKENQYISKKKLIEDLRKNPSILMYYDKNKLSDLFKYIYSLKEEERINIINIFNIHIPIMLSIYNTLGKDYKFEMYGNKYSILHFFCSYAGYNTLNYILNDIDNLDFGNEYDIQLFDILITRLKLETNFFDIIKKNIKKININAQLKDGKTILHNIIIYNNLDYIKFLIDNGADAKIIDNNFKNSFHYACEYSTFDIIMYMIFLDYHLECNHIKYTKLIEKNKKLKYSQKRKLKKIIKPNFFTKFF